MRRSILIAGLTATLAAVALSGCTDASPPLASGSVSNAPPSPSTAASEPEPTSVTEGTVVATGAFDGSGGVQGSVEIVRTAVGWSVRLHGFRSESNNLWLLAYGPAQANGCPSQHWGADIGPVDATAESEISIPGDLSLTSDPTYFDSVGIQLAGFEHTCGSTFYPMAVAQLTWTISPLRSVHPVDSGPRAGAQGILTDGVYEVAAGDTWSDIEARFHLSDDEIAYLNPASQSPQGGAYGASLLARCTLNLAVSQRWRVASCDS